MMADLRVLCRLSWCVAVSKASCTCARIDAALLPYHEQQYDTIQCPIYVDGNCMFTGHRNATSWHIVLRSNAWEGRDGDHAGRIYRVGGVSLAALSEQL